MFGVCESKTNKRNIFGLHKLKYFSLCQDERNIITILEPADSLHSPPVEDDPKERSSSYFPPARLNYYAHTPHHGQQNTRIYGPTPLPHLVTHHIGPSLPPAIMYPAPHITYYQPHPPSRPQSTPATRIDQPQVASLCPLYIYICSTGQDRIDSTGLGLVSVLSSLPGVLQSVLVPVLAAGSAVWISRNLPTPIVHERRRRDISGLAHSKYNPYIYIKLGVSPSVPSYLKWGILAL